MQFSNTSVSNRPNKVIGLLIIIIECFIVVIVGGLGNIWGALLGALITGQIYAFGILLLPKYAMAFLFVLAAVIIIFRPYGLLGRQAQA